jgi:MoaA/NifB/PqqE/SkfB family radical SAM enzyme
VDVNVIPPPSDVVWDITYACPLRCVHCYSESGRRPSRQLDRDGLFRVAEVLIAMKPRAIVFSGGEPLAVPELLELAGRFEAAGVAAHLYTGGWGLRPQMAEPLADNFSKITVSVDGATAGTHDRIRGRAGSFERAMAALARLDEAIGGRRRSGRPSPALGIDFTVMRGNWDEMEAMCSVAAQRFSYLDYLHFGAVTPSGLASRAGFAATESLTAQQLGSLAGQDLARRMASLVPPTLGVFTSDNSAFLMHPDRLAAGEIPALQVEPDGRLRAMPIYEGTVGSLLEEDPLVLWERAVRRWQDPFVDRLLRSAADPARSAAVSRRIDWSFGTDEDRARILARPAYPGTHS